MHVFVASLPHIIVIAAAIFMLFIPVVVSRATLLLSVATVVIRVAAAPAPAVLMTG